MEIDKAIIELGSKLDEWLDRNLETYESQDRATQLKALLKGSEITNELDGLKAGAKTAINALLNRPDSAADVERAASLIRAFELASKVADALHDELLDTDGESEVWHLMDALVRALDKIDSGRAALAALFDNQDSGVRAAAGAYLIDLMPDLVVPMLREIDEKGGDRSADFGAHWTLLAWDLDKKSRFNYLSGNQSG
jgi:hypothetical protein